MITPLRFSAGRAACRPCPSHSFLPSDKKGLFPQATWQHHIILMKSEYWISPTEKRAAYLSDDLATSDQTREFTESAVKRFFYTCTGRLWSGQWSLDAASKKVGASDHPAYSDTCVHTTREREKERDIKVRRHGARDPNPETQATHEQQERPTRMVYNIYTHGPRASAQPRDIQSFKASAVAPRSARKDTSNNGLNSFLSFALNMAVYEVAKQVSRGGRQSVQKKSKNTERQVVHTLTSSA